MRSGLKRSIGGLAAAVLLAGSIGTAVAAESGEPQIAKPELNRVVCKKVKTTGSHFKRKVCMKRKEWRSLQEASRRKMDRINQGAGVRTGSAGGP